jgi:XTP/dITP diphosphohydrolase
MNTLREHCPWDKKQTFDTLRNLTLEEAYELTDAIAKHDINGIREEVGDLFLHLVFYAKLGAEVDAFDIDECLDGICEKLIRRHPHIYADVIVADEHDVKRNWESIKKREGKSILEGVPTALPAMVKAVRLQEKTKQVGFEWENAEQVWEKVEEEIQEFRQIQEAQPGSQKASDEFGDILFSLINYARFQGIDPELALERVNLKFIRRFQHIEIHAPKPLEEMTLAEMDALWTSAKGLEDSKT